MFSKIENKDFCTENLVLLAKTQEILTHEHKNAPRKYCSTISLAFHSILSIVKIVDDIKLNQNYPEVLMAISRALF
jgi:hypothetical protein